MSRSSGERSPTRSRFRKTCAEPASGPPVTVTARQAGMLVDPVQEDLQVGFFDLFAIGAVLGGDPQGPPLVPQERPFVGEPAELGELAWGEVHGVAWPGSSRRGWR